MSICKDCFHSYVCEQFNEHRECDNTKCHFFNDHFVSTADVVKVVRCKDCKHAKLDLMEKGLAVCRRPVLKNGQLLPLNLENKYNDYCSYGELKESER